MIKIELKTIIPKNLSGQRLDLALSKLFPEHSRARIQSWIKAGEVEVNDSKYKQRALVSSGDVIKINAKLKSVDANKPEPIKLDIIHDDSSIIIINKASGLVVHPGAETKNTSKCIITLR